MPFEWTPGTKLDKTALDRMKQHFPKPSEPPFEAWFMGKTNYHDHIIELSPHDLDISSIQHYLEDSITGLRSFYKAEKPVRRWRETFNYLLPYLIEKIHEGYLLEYLVSHFFMMYPDDIEPHYPEFRLDVLNTLGKALMLPFFWDDTDLSSEVLEVEFQHWMSYGESDFFRIISPAIFFCLKYLTPEEIKHWIMTLSKIKGMHWHYHWLAWIYRATVFLLFSETPNNMPKKIPISGNLAFGSYPFTSTFTIPPQNLLAFVGTLKEHRIFYT